jgi:hypothetical protein
MGWYGHGTSGNLEHVIAGVSMRFINTQPQDIDAGIAQALADMAECIGSDRAYFVSTGAEPRLHVWCKPACVPKTLSEFLYDRIG